MNEAVVLIPAYNPFPDLARLVRELIALGIHAVVIVDEGGDNKNRPAFEALSAVGWCHILHLSGHAGRGCALKAGLIYIRDSFTEISAVVTVNPDEGFTAEDIVAVAQAVDADRREILIGSRINKEGRPAARSLACRIIRISFSLLAGINVADPRAGLRGFPASLLPWLLEFQTTSRTFEFDVLLVAKRHGIMLRQITSGPLDPQRPSAHRSITFAEFVRVYALLIIFSLSSLVSYLFDIGIYALLIGTVFAQIQNAASILYCTVIARILSSILNFVINKRIVFRDLRSDYTIFVRYVILTLLRMFASFAGVYAFTSALGIDSRIIKVGVDLILFFIGFRVQQSWVFARPVDRESAK